MAKTKKMTKGYWESLSDGSKKRALKFCFPLMPSTIEMMANEKVDLKSGLWKVVFTKVRIPEDSSYYKTVINNTYVK